MAERGVWRRLLPWVPVVFWLGVIALESSSLASAQNTASILYALLRKLFVHASPEQLAWLHMLIRKIGHFTGYAILSLFFFRALRATILSNLARLWIWSVGLTCVVAILDEWHQATLPSRTGSLRDVALDTMGAMVMQVVVLIVTLTRVGRSQSERRIETN